VDRATRALAQRFSPVVGWQQPVVDSTEGARGVLNVLYGRLWNPAHRWVIFDVNRQQAAAERDAAPGSPETVRRSALDWTSGLVPLGHEALPFPPADPIYGFIADNGQFGLPSIGSLLLRGESGVLTVSLGSLTWLRSNPFLTLIDEDVAAMAGADHVATPVSCRTAARAPYR